MPTVVTGRVVDESGTPMEGVRVVALGDWFLTTERLAAPAVIGGDGRFSIEVKGPTTTAEPLTSFRVRVIDVVGRQLRDDTEVPGTVPTRDLGDVTVHPADGSGLEVTNLTGTPLFVTTQNAVKLLVDGAEAFGRIAEDIKGATASVEMTQLFFALPDFSSDPAEQDKPALIFNFREPLVAVDPLRPDPNGPAPTRSLGDRPELLLTNQAAAGRTIRILLNDPELGWPEGWFWLGLITAGLGLGAAAGLAFLAGVGLALFPVLLATVVVAMVEYFLIRRVLSGASDVDKAKTRFGNVLSTPPIAVRGFGQALPAHGVLHCKVVITDRQRAVVVGSPFSQRYFDFPAHRIEDAHRGSNTSDMVHDLSISVVGPAVHGLHEAFRLYWNEDLDQADELPEAAVPGAATAGPDELLTTLQVVRTASETRFKALGDKSEKGILEGYLRAFATAKEYIYLETQYFTDGVITDALVAALNAKPALELILVVPIKPDVLFYPRRQAARIDELRRAGGTRVGVFTRWSYEPKPGRPWVAPVYIHSKGGVVDDSWATVGSANLDGLSLDYNLLLSPLAFGETTAAELNVNVLPPTPGEVTPFAQLMRRRLFAEHLGLGPEDRRLGADRPASWLQGLWRPHAKVALDHVKAATQLPLPGFVLEYPADDGGWLDTPRKHLAALGVQLRPSAAVVRPLTRTRKFHFATGLWDKTPELEDIDQ